MNSYKINFINHASMLIDDGISKFLTDPWYISPAFGTWYQNPPPQYSDLQKIIDNKDDIHIIISHGHDDHLDELFINNYLNNSQIIISKFKSKGFLRRVSKLSTKNPIEINQDFTMPTKIKNNLIYSYSNDSLSNDSIILITNQNELIIHANDNYREQPKHIIDEIKKISENKKIYYFSQVGIASAFPAGFPNIPIDEKKKIIRLEHERFISAFEKNIKNIRPNLAFTYANQYKFDNEENLSYYDDAQDLISNHNFINQLLPGDEIINGKLIRNKNKQDNSFNKLLENLENHANEFIKKKIETNFQLFFKIIKNRFDKNRSIPKVKSNEIYLATDKATWLSIISGKTNLETILIGANGDVIKIHEENMREISICLNEFSYIYQNRITKSLFN